MQAGCPLVSVQSFNWAVHVIQMVVFGFAVVRCCWFLSSDLLIQFKKSFKNLHIDESRKETGLLFWTVP
jgi:hypothetical protein